MSLSAIPCRASIETSVPSVESRSCCCLCDIFCQASASAPSTLETCTLSQKSMAVITMSSSREQATRLSRFDSNSRSGSALTGRAHQSVGECSQQKSHVSCFSDHGSARMAVKPQSGGVKERVIPQPCIAQEVSPLYDFDNSTKPSA